VNEEIHRLDHNADAAFETVNLRFQAVLENVEKQRQGVLANVREKRDEKKKVLEEQIQIIQAEKEKVDQDVRVRNKNNLH
jgi:tripartite motif-containing protein 2/3